MTDTLIIHTISLLSKESVQFGNLLHLAQFYAESSDFSIDFVRIQLTTADQLFDDFDDQSSKLVSLLFVGDHLALLQYLDDQIVYGPIGHISFRNELLDIFKVLYGQFKMYEFVIEVNEGLFGSNVQEAES